MQNRIDNTDARIKAKTADMQIRVTQAETKEKLNIERQRVFETNKGFKAVNVKR